MNERSIFIAALEKDDPVERTAYLDEVCGTDVELRQRIDRLLRAHVEAGFLDQPAVAPENPVAGNIPQEPTFLHTPSTESVGARIGNYKLLQQIGEGGMGTVWMAEQTSPVKRMVALKVIKAGMDTAQVVARFEAERQALALMDHPNIARVLDAGTTESGRPYFIMELVKGVAITKYCDEHQLTLRERMELFIPVCQAVQHAHQKGIIHRDLKPSNVMIASYDGRPVPKVIDFGVAKAMGQQLTERTMFTGFGGIVGTLEYMSPEQAEFNALDIDTRSDIYSLGVILYELLTGSTPLTKQQLHQAAISEVLRLIREVDSPKPSTRLSDSRESLASLSAQRKLDPTKLAKEVSGELDWIVMKALEKDRTRRYETATGLARDVERYLLDEAVEACPPSLSYRLRKVIRRHRRTAGVSAVVVFLIVAMLTNHFVGYVRLKEARGRAVAESNRATMAAAEAQAERDRAMVEADRARAAEGVAKIERDKAVAAQLETDKARKEEARQKDIARSMAVAQAHSAEMVAKGIVIIKEQRDKAIAAERKATAEANRADAKAEEARRSLYVSHMYLVQAAWDDARVGTVLDLLKQNEPQPGTADLRGFEWHYWNRLAQTYRLSLDGQARVMSVVLSPDGKRVASASWDRTIKVWDATSGQLQLTLKGHTGAVRSVTFSPDGTWLASGSRDKTVKLWDSTSGQEKLTLKGHVTAVMCVAISPDGKRVVSASGETDKPGEIKVWDVSNGQETLNLKMQSGGVAGVAFSPTGDHLASTNHSEVRVWDATSGNEILKLAGHTRGLKGLAYSPDGRWIATASVDHTAKIWDAKDGHETVTLRGHTGAVTGVAFSADGQRLASASFDQTVKVWDTTSGQEIRTLKGHTRPLTTVAISADGERLVSGGEDETVKVWDATSGEESRTLLGHTDGVGSVAFSPDGNRLASGSKDQTAKVWDAESGREIITLKGHQGEVAGVAFSPDGKRLASACTDKTVIVWDIATGQAALTLKGHESAINCVAFSRDGKWLASASFDRTVKVWDATSGQATLTLKGHTHEITSVTFSVDGKLLASACIDQTVRLWNATSGEEIFTLKGNAGPVWGVAFSPDGKRLASANTNRTVKLWDTTSGKEVLTIKGHAGLVWSVAFSPDGNRLATGGDYRDSLVKVWDATSGQETLTLKGHTSAIMSVAFSRDGKRIASASGDKSVKVWDASPRHPGQH